MEIEYYLNLKEKNIDDYISNKITVDQKCYIREKMLGKLDETLDSTNNSPNTLFKDLDVTNKIEKMKEYL